MNVIDYYFYSASPFTYLGHQAIINVAEKHGATLSIKPVDLKIIWAESGAVPPAQRPLVRQRYRLIELQRVAQFRRLPINKQPAFFPVDAALADCSIAAIVHSGGDPLSYMNDIFAATWAHEKDISDERVLSALLEKNGFEAVKILISAKSDTIAAIREQNSKDAVAVDAVGVPAYVFKGEVFWGQDRVEMLDHMLTTGRAPFSA